MSVSFTQPCHTRVTRVFSALLTIEAVLNWVCGALQEVLHSWTHSTFIIHFSSICVLKKIERQCHFNSPDRQSSQWPEMRRLYICKVTWCIYYLGHTLYRQGAKGFLTFNTWPKRAIESDFHRVILESSPSFFFFFFKITIGLCCPILSYVVPNLTEIWLAKVKVQNVSQQ